MEWKRLEVGLRRHGSSITGNGTQLKTADQATAKCWSMQSYRHSDSRLLLNPLRAVATPVHCLVNLQQFWSNLFNVRVKAAAAAAGGAVTG